MTLDVRLMVVGVIPENWSRLDLIMTMINLHKALPYGIKITKAGRLTCEFEVITFDLSPPTNVDYQNSKATIDDLGTKQFADSPWALKWGGNELVKEYTKMEVV